MRSFRVLLLFVTASAMLLDAGDALSQAPVQAPVVQAPVVQAPGTSAVLTSLIVNSAVGVPGDSRTFEVRLRRGNQAPIPGKTVSLSFTGPSDPNKKQIVVKAGSLLTDPDGIARFRTKLPVLGAGQYRVVASFDGAGDLMPSTASNTVGIAKGVGRIVFTPVEKSDLGNKCKTTITLFRNSDDSVHSAQATLRGNRVVGTDRTVTLPYLLIEYKEKWDVGPYNNVTATFAGDETMQAVEATLDVPQGGCRN